MNKFNFYEIQKDIFEISDKDYYKAHCISADYKLGAGIAKEFDKRYNLRNRLLAQEEEREFPDCIIIDNIFNIVTKLHYYDKPTYKNFRLAISIFKDLVEKHSIRHIAMPTIGYGLDRLEWTKVRKILINELKYLDCEILVCHYPIKI